MRVTEALAQAAAVVTLGLGVMGLLWPARAARFTGLSALHRTGFGEFRSTYGGLFVGLGLAPLVTGAPTANGVVAAAWLCTGVGRLVSIVFDGGAKEPRSFGALALETGLGLALMPASGWW